MIKCDLIKTKSQSDPKPHTEQIFPFPAPVIFPVPVIPGILSYRCCKFRSFFCCSPQKPA